MKTLQRILTAWLLLLAGGTMLTVSAQDGYSPDNPPEPNLRLKVSVTATNGYASGSGTYLSGTEVAISTSAYSENYTFAYWTMNGEKYTEEQTFAYTVTDRNVNFNAVYDYTPVNPSEPKTPDTYHVYLSCDEANSCSFNRTSGARAKAGTYVTLTVNPSQGYKFRGWYLDGVKQSDALTFNYLMPASDISFEVQLVYDPDNPDEPESDGSQSGNISKSPKGDVNEDGVADTADAVLIISHYVEGTTEKLSTSVADVTGDGTIDTADAVKIINTYVNNE